MATPKTARLLKWLAIGVLVAIGWIIVSADGGELPPFITAPYASRFTNRSYITIVPAWATL
jgi:hypothetical protein